MKLRRNISGNKDVGEGKRGFPALKGMIENSSRAAMVLMAVSFAVPACSGGDQDTDSGRPDAALDGSRPDTGVLDSGGADSGVADSDVPASLCAMFGEGHVNRHTFGLMDSKSIDSSNWRMEFRKLTIFGERRFAAFNFHDITLTAAGFESFEEGEQRPTDVPGYGTVRFELCKTSGGECNGSLIPPSGDVSCTATLVVDAGWSD